MGSSHGSGFGEAARELRESAGAGAGAGAGAAWAAASPHGTTAADAHYRFEYGAHSARDDAMVAGARLALSRLPPVASRPVSSRQLPPQGKSVAKVQRHQLIGLGGRRPASAGDLAPTSMVPTARREDLYAALMSMRRKESALEAELMALKTRRRQREQRAMTAARAAAGISPAAARLRDELMAVQRQRDLIAEKGRELEQTRLRVRPKDIATLQRAKALVAKTQEAVDEQRRKSEGDLGAVQGRIDRLARVQRERLELSHRHRAALQRERLEGRILREELAFEMEEYEEYGFE